MIPTSSVVADLVELLNSDLREAFEERAGIIEFDANQPRDVAECLALLDVLRRHPGALLGVTALQVELNRATRYVLTTDAEFAKKHLASLDVRVVRAVDATQAIRGKFCGVALLSRIS